VRDDHWRPPAGLPQGVAGHPQVRQLEDDRAVELHRGERGAGDDHLNRQQLEVPTGVRGERDAGGRRPPQGPEEVLHLIGHPRAVEGVQH
jgi:hypothetical protein